MGQPKIDNKTPFAFETIFLTDEEGRLLFVPVVKATYSIQPGKELSLAEEQVAVNPGGEYWGDPDNSSYKYEPEVAFFKPATDVVLIGHAYPRRPGQKEVIVSLQAGSLKKSVKVLGDRYWVKVLGLTRATDPESFEKIPLIYERAFGGWDRRDEDPSKHKFEPRNPVGTGFLTRSIKGDEKVRLPNLLDPGRPLRSWKDKPPPAGFGFTSPHWQPRAMLAGTYDERWEKRRKPLLPEDFDRRFFNAASAGLIAPGFFNGREQIMIENASPEGGLLFNLPGVLPPECVVELRRRADEKLQTALDTVVINTNEMIVLLIWRSNLKLKSDAEEVLSVEVRAEGVSAAT